MKCKSALLFSILCLGVKGCSGSATNATNRLFNVELRATSDDGEPVAGARFLYGARSLGESDPMGAVATTLQGDDGQTVAVTVKCPEGYVGPDQPTWLKLTEVRRVDQTGPAVLGVEMTCVRRLRDIVVIIRTANAPDLPVDVGGKNLGTTDADGIAHFLLHVDRDTRTLSVSLETSKASNLRPQNPSRIFELDGEDAILLLDQNFSLERRRFVSPRMTPAPAPTKRIPYRIGG